MSDQPAVHRAALSRLAGRPVLDADAAADLLDTQWGIHGALSSLPSERDQNWLVSRDESPALVFKIANRDEDPAVIDLQQQLMSRAAAGGLPVPGVVATPDGRGCVEADGRRLWLIERLPGRILAEVPAPSPDLLTDLGQVLGRLAVALDGYDHPAAHRRLQWDVQHGAEVLDAYRDTVIEPEHGRLLDRCRVRYDQHVRPALATLPRAVVHNDANDHNVLVAGERVSGLIDFGDAVHTVRVNEVAVACAYAMFGRSEPWTAAEAIIDGYQRQVEITAAERAILPDLIRTRLATSVSISGHQHAQAPSDDYLRVSENSAWHLLEHLTRDKA